VTHQENVPQNNGDEVVDSKKSLGVFAVILLLVGCYALYKEVDTVWQLIKHSIFAVVWFWAACSCLFGAFTLWGRRRIGMRVRDYGAIVIAPLAIFPYAYKGAKLANTARTRLSWRQKRQQRDAANVVNA
jgi:hypothetical protein